MKNILFISYFYPPLGGGGIQRTLMFSVYLKQLGWNVSVLTVKDGPYRVRDESLLKLVEENEIKVYRAPTLENIWKRKDNQNPNQNFNATEKKTPNIKWFKLKTWLRNLLIPDKQILWYYPAYLLGKKVIQDEKVSIIYSTSPPITNHLIAYKLKRKFKIPWVCDFRDLWTMDARYSSQGIRLNIENKIEKNIMKNNDLLITLNQYLLDSIFQKYEQHLKNTLLVPNGYIPDANEKIILENNEKFIIGYFGSFYSLRSPEIVIKSIHQLIHNQLIDFKNIEFHIYGSHDLQMIKKINEIVNQYELKEIVLLKPYLNHEEFQIKMKSMNLLLLFIAGDEKNKGMCTGKIFEYIQSKVPILALVPDGIAKDIIMKTNTGYCVNPKDQEQIEECIYKCYELWKNNQLKISPDFDEIKKYDRRYLSEKLHHELQKIIS